MILSEQDYVKYPFLKAAGARIKETGNFSIEHFGTDVDLKYIVETACERVVDAIHGKKFSKNTDNVEIHLLSFALASLLLRVVNDHILYGKFALTEAIRAESFLNDDFMKHDSAIEVVLNELFGPILQRDGISKVVHTVRIPVNTYVRHSVQFNDPHWKLVNQTVSKGYVILDIHEGIRLLRPVLTKYIVKKISNSPKLNIYDKDGNCLYPNFEPCVKKLKELAVQYGVQPVTQNNDIPPCIDDALRVLERGENLSNSGRFMLASYFTSKEWPVEDIASLFKTAPDYNPRTTNYHVAKIAEVGYTCPGCTKLESQGLCRRTVDCGYIKNPLQFRRKNH